MPTGNKILQQQTINAINDLITENKTTQTQLTQLEIKLDTLDEIVTELKIQKKHSEIITNEEIKEDEIE